MFDEKVYSKKYYSKNSDRLKLSHKEYYDKNKERIKSSRKKYYDKNKEKIKERNRKYSKAKRHRPIMGIIRHCKLCGKEFKTYPSKIKIGGGKFCSLKCVGKWSHLYNRGKKGAGYKYGPVEKVCQVCGKKFTIRRYFEKKGWGKYCSKKCMGVAQGLRQQGINNPRYKDGRTPENVKIRKSIEGRLWREAVFARDNYTCQKCGQHGWHLNAHHIKDFAEFIELRTSIKNGITFCKNCHDEFHRLFGRKKNSELQIRKFLSEQLLLCH